MISAAAAAIIDQHSRARGALVVAASTGRLTDDDIPFLASTIIKTARRVGRSLEQPV